MNSTFKDLSLLYKDMEEAYVKTAKEADLSCSECPDNCCTGYFKHRTRVEWAYLFEGLSKLTSQKQDEVFARAQDYIQIETICLTNGEAPKTMCPLNEKGLCILYEHRLMICRMHGTKNEVNLPDGTKQDFPGCSRFVSLTKDLKSDEVPSLDRTPYYQRLANLEMSLLKRIPRALPRVNMTIAEMIVEGPPTLR